MNAASQAAVINYSSAAILTRQLQRIFTAQNTTVGQIVSQDTLAVDAQCPFFYLYAMGGQATATAGAAFVTTFDFYNGGTSITSTGFGWGNAAALNTAGSPYVFVLTTPNDGVGYFNDPVSGTCSGVNPGSLFYQGLIKRWTALADQIIVTTKCIGAYSSANPYQIVHGVLQQPW